MAQSVMCLPGERQGLPRHPQPSGMVMGLTSVTTVLGMQKQEDDSLATQPTGTNELQAQ